MNRYNDFKERKKEWISAEQLLVAVLLLPYNNDERRVDILCIVTYWLLFL
nr:MAG TPA: hypothetical protein [Caudoviricetes sp.]